MSQPSLYALAALALCAVGLYGFLAYRHLLRKILALNVFGSGVFLLFVAIARRVPHATPDPVPHAMVLTGIVVTVSTTALALALMRRIASQTAGAALREDSKHPPSPPQGE